MIGQDIKVGHQSFPVDGAIILALYLMSTGSGCTASIEFELLY